MEFKSSFDSSATDRLKSVNFLRVVVEKGEF